MTRQRAWCWVSLRSTQPTDTSLLQSIAVQLGAVGVEPHLGAVGRRTEREQHAPEARRVIHLEELRDLVRGEIVEHVRRREDEAPGEGQHAGRRARAPAARLIADRDAFGLDAQLLRVAAARRLEIALRLALEIIGHASPDMRRRA